MPTYVFENKDTGEVFEDFMKISEAEEYLEKNTFLNDRIKAIIEEINL